MRGLRLQSERRRSARDQIIGNRITQYTGSISTSRIVLSGVVVLLLQSRLGRRWWILSKFFLRNESVGIRRESRLRMRVVQIRERGLVSMVRVRIDAGQVLFGRR